MKRSMFALILLLAASMLAASVFHLGDNSFGDDPGMVSDSSVVVDGRDGVVYPYVTFGDLHWMARNLAYASSESECYGGDPAHCATYGRMYPYGESRQVCPEGWRLPRPSEWKALKKAIGSGKADHWVTGEWNDPAFAAADNASGLAILPGGRVDEHGSYDREGRYGELGLSSSYWLDDGAYHWHVRWGKSHIHKHGAIAGQGRKFYVRCVCAVGAE